MLHVQSFEVREVVVSIRSSFEHSFGHLQDLLLVLLLVLEKSDDVRDNGLVREGESGPLKEGRKGENEVSDELKQESQRWRRRTRASSRYPLRVQPSLKAQVLVVVGWW